jgi:hypothetical protein
MSGIDVHLVAKAPQTLPQRARHQGVDFKKLDAKHLERDKRLAGEAQLTPLIDAVLRHPPFALIQKCGQPSLERHQNHGLPIAGCRRKRFVCGSGPLISTPGMNRGRSQGQRVSWS